MDLGGHERVAARLRAAAAPGGGFGPRPGSPAEPEQTAVATLALDDAAARQWLIAHQRSDGRFTPVPGAVEPTAATALAALALPEGPARLRALDALESTRARTARSEPVSPHDPASRGWGWTPTTFGWVEPTAWAVLALKRLRPGARPLIADGEHVLADRESVGGGWNYGNRTVYGEDLPPYVQTTAVAVLALQGTERTELLDRGVELLVRRWSDEPGGLSLALTLAALRLAGADGDAGAASAAGRAVEEVSAALNDLERRTGLLDDVLTMAWATLATGPNVEQLRVGRP